MFFPLFSLLPIIPVKIGYITEKELFFPGGVTDVCHRLLKNLQFRDKIVVIAGFPCQSMVCLG